MQTLQLLLLFAVPGFITLTIYRRFVASEPLDASKAGLDVVTYSFINYGFMSAPIYLYFKLAPADPWPGIPAIGIFILLFIAPCFLGYGLYRFESASFFNVNPIKKPWDYLFSQGRQYWVIVELDGGQRVGGIYGSGSFSSSYPSDEQIYLEQEWELDGRIFVKAVDRSEGIIISGANIKRIEFYN